MLLGGLLLLLPWFGLQFAMDHFSAFLDATRTSDPAALSTTNNIVLASVAAGCFGLVLLSYCLVSFFRGGHPRLPAHAGVR